MRTAAPTAALLAGCASTVAGSRGDAPDAAPPSNLEITVLLDLAPRGMPGADVPARVVDGAGAAVEARTGTDGVLRLQLDPARAYDVTVAFPGHVAVSLVGVRVPLRTSVRLPPQRVTDAADTRRRTFPVTIAGRSAARSGVVLDGASGVTVARDDTVTLSVADWAGAPAGFWLSAVELDGASNLLRAGYATVASRAAPGAVSVALTMRPRSDALRVEFPFVGRVTPSTFGAAMPGSVLRFKQTERGEGAVPVGVSTLRAPDATGSGIWTITRFDGPLAPELSTFTYATRDGALRGTVTLQPPFAGLVPAVFPVERLATRASGPGAFAFTADVGAWSRAYFEVVSNDGTLLWRGFSLDRAPWVDRPLPALPSSVAASDVLGRAALRARACVAQDAPQMGQLPWSHTRPPLAFWSRLSVCDAGAASP